MFTVAVPTARDEAITGGRAPLPSCVDGIGDGIGGGISESTSESRSESISESGRERILSGKRENKRKRTQV